jgi:hypothetical protein
MVRGSVADASTALDRRNRRFEFAVQGVKCLCVGSIQPRCRHAISARVQLPRTEMMISFHQFFSDFEKVLPFYLPVSPYK